MIEQLAAHTHAVLDRRSREYHITCPECGAQSRPAHPHCSFSAHGWHCFVCGAGGSLADLARKVNLQGDYSPTPAPRPQPERPRSWMADPELLLRRYESHPRRFELWQAHKPVSEDTIRRMRLGVGVLPSSKCAHMRLIVPIISGSLVVGLRGRRIDCSCSNWTVAAGTVLDNLPLYNQDALRPGSVVWIVENCVDALLIGDHTPYTGVATYSVSYWRDEWLETLRRSQPEMIFVCYDNDIPGQGGGLCHEEFAREWLQTHPRLPEPAGPKLANRLRAAGLPAILYDWGRAPHKSDIGTIIINKG